MQAYILRRVILGMLTGALVSLLIFALLRIAPGDVAMMIATQDDPNAAVTEADLEEIRIQLGLNASLPMQYITWMANVMTLDWGVSLYHGEAIWDTFKKKIPVTFELVLMTVTMATVFGIPIGIVMALKQDTWIDYFLRIFSLAGLSMPNFWTATLLLVGGMYLLDWNPRLQYVSFVEDPLANLRQFCWPALILSYAGTATRARMMRSTMLEVLRQDYIRTAHAKGLRSFVVTYRHALKNAFIPVITIIGVSIAVTMGGSVIIERIFVLPGIGNMLVEGMNNRDYPVVQSLILVFAMWIVLVNLIVDLTYGWLDPRIRYS
ncbi:ABC transporter permease [SAR202 cluster bacterium AC-647-N09_OGT_505m]|nr:ABC transporter permease [SAR202 cluster bacterium AC-647-N09_OGT_505m]